MLKLDKNTRILLFGFIILLIVGVSFSLFDFGITGKSSHPINNNEQENFEGERYSYFTYDEKREKIQGPFDFKSGKFVPSIVKVDFNIEQIKMDIRKIIANLKLENERPNPTIYLPKEGTIFTLSYDTNIGFSIGDKNKKDIKKAELFLRSGNKELKLNTKVDALDLTFRGFTNSLWKVVQDYEEINEMGFEKYDLVLKLTDKKGEFGEETIPVELKNDGRTYETEERKKEEPPVVNEDEKIPPFVESDDTDPPDESVEGGCSAELRIKGKADEKIKGKRGLEVTSELGSYNSFNPHDHDYLIGFNFEFHANADPETYKEGQWKKEIKGSKTPRGWKKEHNYNEPTEFYGITEGGILQTLLLKEHKGRDTIHWIGIDSETYKPNIASVKKEVEYVTAVWKEENGKITDICKCRFEINVEAINSDPAKFAINDKYTSDPNWKVTINEINEKSFKGVTCNLNKEDIDRAEKIASAQK